MMQNKNIKIYIEPMWVKGELDLYTINHQFSRIQVKSFIKEKRQKFIERLQNEGFEITYNKEDITEDTICLIMDDTSLCDINTPLNEYKKVFDQKIFSSAGKHLNYPFSMSVCEYFEQPFFPAVFKTELENGGLDKFLIENIEQLETIKSFYDEYYKQAPYKEVFDNSIFQQYLENPGKYKTYLRVLSGGIGDVMGASLKYSAEINEKFERRGLLESIFLNPDSKYFIGAKKMFNYYSGGENISFSQPRYSYEKVKILNEHGFDTNNLVLPSEVLDVCENIMQNCNRQLGVLCGFDFMLNKEDGKWYYLENQAFPAIEEWADNKNVSLPTSHNIKGYMRYLELELQPRYEALMSLVNNKKKNTSEEKPVVLQKR